jgi:hypothetical protein
MLSWVQYLRTLQITVHYGLWLQAGGLEGVCREAQACVPGHVAWQIDQWLKARVQQGMLPQSLLLPMAYDNKRGIRGLVDGVVCLGRGNAGQEWQ